MDEILYCYGLNFDALPSTSSYVEVLKSNAMLFGVETY